jgi:hypothetical protein
VSDPLTITVIGLLGIFTLAALTGIAEKLENIEKALKGLQNTYTRMMLQKDEKKK